MKKELTGYKLTPSRNEYTTEQKEELYKHYHKDIVDNDILAELILLYPFSTVDMNGTEVTIDDETMRKVVEKSNDALDDKLKRPLNKVRSFIDGKNANTVDFIPMIKDHIDEVDNTIGFSRGYLEAKSIADIPCVIGNVLISEIKAKQKVKDGLLKGISVGIREDFTIKEISFVNNPALPDAGLLSEPKSPKVKKMKLIEKPTVKNLKETQTLLMQLSENSNEIKKTKVLLQEKEIQLAEIKKNIYIEKNLTKLMQAGKILPRDLDDHRYNFAKLQSMDNIKHVVSILTQTTPLVEFGATYNKNADFAILGEAIMSKDFNEVMARLKKATDSINKKFNKNFRGAKLSQPNIEDSDLPEEHEAEKAAGNKGMVPTGKKDKENLKSHHKSKHLSEEEHHEKMKSCLSQLSEIIGEDLPETHKIEKLKHHLMAQMAEYEEEDAEEIPQEDHIKKMHEHHKMLMGEHEEVKKRLDKLEEQHHQILDHIGKISGHLEGKGE